MKKKADDAKSQASRGLTLKSKKTKSEWDLSSDDESSVDSDDKNSEERAEEEIEAEAQIIADALDDENKPEEFDM